jgi:hypothetical protein
VICNDNRASRATQGIAATHDLDRVVERKERLREEIAKPERAAAPKMRSTPLMKVFFTALLSPLCAPALFAAGSWPRAQASRQR